MAKERGDIFADDALSDLSAFKPKGDNLPPRPGPEALAQIGQGTKFVSREPVAPSPPQPAKAVREKWRYRTGRDQQFNTRASQQTKDGFEALAQRLNCPVAEVVERALEALQRELDHKEGQGDGR